MADDQKPPFPPRLTNAIIATVTLIWALSFIMDIVLETYDPSPYVHLIMMTVVGAITGRVFIRGGNGS